MNRERSARFRRVGSVVLGTASAGGFTTPTAEGTAGPRDEGRSPAGIVDVCRQEMTAIMEATASRWVLRTHARTLPIVALVAMGPSQCAGRTGGARRSASLCPGPHVGVPRARHAARVTWMPVSRHDAASRWHHPHLANSTPASPCPALTPPQSSWSGSGWSGSLAACWQRRLPATTRSISR